MFQVVIIGNSGAARECYALFREMQQGIPSFGLRYAFKGFLSWRGYAGNLKRHAGLLLGDAEEYQITCRDLFVIGIADPGLRRDVYQCFKGRGACFLTLVHPWSEVSPDAVIGEANIFQRGTHVDCGSVIGNANYFNGAVMVAHDSRVGDCNFIGPWSLLQRKCRIGNGNSLGVRSVIAPASILGSHNLIAPGSIVMDGCTDYCRMAGNPAIRIGDIAMET